MLISDTAYHQENDGFLCSLLDEGYELFCAVGVDRELWEEGMKECSDIVQVRSINITAREPISVKVL